MKHLAPLSFSTWKNKQMIGLINSMLSYIIDTRGIQSISHTTNGLLWKPCCIRALEFHVVNCLCLFVNNCKLFNPATVDKDIHCWIIDTHIYILFLFQWYNEASGITLKSEFLCRHLQKILFHIWCNSTVIFVSYKV